MIGNPVEAYSATRRLVPRRELWPGAVRPRLPECRHQHGTAPDHDDGAHEGEQDDGMGRDGRGIDRHPGRDEEDRDEQSERQPVQLVLQRGMPRRQDATQDEPRSKRPEHDVELEGRASSESAMTGSTTRRTVGWAVVS
jgi:hypothetical protein